MGVNDDLGGQFPIHHRIGSGIPEAPKLVDKPLPADANRSWVVTVRPTVLPVTVEEVKLYARIDGKSEDELITSFIESVTDTTEEWLRRALLSQSIVMSMDWWPRLKISLPRPPLISITQVRTLDEDDVATVYDAANYFIDTSMEPGLLVLKHGVTPPQNTVRFQSGYEIELKGGYGTVASAVPAGIKTGIKAWVANVYDTRQLTPIPPPSVMGFLMPFRVPNL